MIVIPLMIVESRGPAHLYRTTDQPSAPARPRRYPSETTDAEWALIESLLPTLACQSATGR